MAEDRRERRHHPPLPWEKPRCGDGQTGTARSKRSTGGSHHGIKRGKTGKEWEDDNEAFRGKNRIHSHCDDGWGLPPRYADFWSDAAKPYQGVTIRGVSESTPPSNYVKDVLAPEFTKATGINVEFEATSWDQMYDKAIKDMEANTGIYDFVYIEQDIVYSYLARDFLVDLTKSLADNPDLKAPTFNFDEFTSFIDYFKNDDGDVFGVPMEAFVKVYLYRKDLFGDPEVKDAFKAKYGYDLAPATTHQQYQDIADFFTPVGQGQRHGAVGHHGAGPFRPSGVVVRVLRKLGPDLRRL